jgi:hypothetical protein
MKPAKRLFCFILVNRSEVATPPGGFEKNRCNRFHAGTFSWRKRATAVKHQEMLSSNSKLPAVGHYSTVDIIIRSMKDLLSAAIAFFKSLTKNIV